MKIGFIGLGRMGSGMVERLLKNKIKVVAFNRSPDKVREIIRKGAEGAFSLSELTNKLGERKIIWMMLPAGSPTDEMIKAILPLLSKEDIIINGANDFYENSKKYEKWCGRFDVHFFDCGVSNGIEGLQNGYTLMFGGPKSEFKSIEIFCRALAPKNGYGYFGEAGSGHYVKSVHNIIEYVYLQGIAEGIELLDKGGIDIKKAISVFRPSSVISSWLLDRADTAINRPDFSKIDTKIGSVTIDELKKTLKAAKGYAPAFRAAVKVRESKGNKFKLGKKVIAATRREFGGHPVSKK